MWCVGGLARWWLAVAVAVAVAGAAEILEEGEELPYPSPLSLFPRLGRDDCTAPGGECLGRELCVATLAGNRRHCRRSPTPHLNPVTPSPAPASPHHRTH